MKAIPVMPLCIVWCIVCMLLSSLVPAEVVELTDAKDRRIKAELLELEEDRLKILFNKKEMWIALDTLNEQSRLAVKCAFAKRAEGAAVRNEQKMFLPNGEKIEPGKVHRFTVELTKEQEQWNKESTVGSYVLCVAFPQQFDPGKSCPVFFVNTTTSGNNADSVKGYSKVANQLGYVVIGAQATDLRNNKEMASLAVRGELTYLAIESLSNNWPDILKSPWYYGGNSGGAKNCCFLSVYLYEIYKVAPSGFFMGGCNEMKMTTAIEYYNSAKQPFRDTAFFISNGSKDNTATPAQGEQVEKELNKNGFRTTRREVFSGGHEVSSEHFAEALKWFNELRARP